TYQTSSLNLSLQDIAFLPLTCAHPVIPGFTSCRRNCSALYKGRYSIKSGLGPTRLMSPFSTFHKPGSSSKLDDRSKEPNLVKRAESGNKLPSLSRSSVIDLNLYILNGFPLIPGLT